MNLTNVKRTKPVRENIAVRRIAMRVQVMLVVAIGVLIASAPVSTHHLLVGAFDVNKAITLTGTVTKMQWINPHGLIHVDVKGPEGTTEEWVVETGSPYQLQNLGFEIGDVPIGVEVFVEGFVAKNGTRTVGGEYITLVGGREVVYELRKVVKTRPHLMAQAVALGR